MALCAAGVAVIAGSVQLTTWLLGIDFDILSGSGSGVLLAIALGCLLTLMSADRRPASDFGLFVGPQWKKLWFRGMGIGVVTLGTYLTIATLAGVYRFDTSQVTAYRCFKAIFAAMTSCPLAIVEQIMFSGYLLGILRSRYSRLTAVVVPALLFGLLAQLQNPAGIFTPQGQLLVVGIFFAATLLGILRLVCGSILMPAGLLAGWLVVSRLVGKMRLLVWQPSEPWSNWLAPYADPRRGPAMWVLLSLGILGTAIYLWRRGEGRVKNIDASMDPTFKRLFPLSSVSMLAPLDVWIRQLVAARFRVGLPYVPRLIAALVTSSVNTVLTLPERIVVPLLIRRTRIKDPVFVVGTHRSGTTHLHNLLSMDPQFQAPRAYQTINPYGCLLSGWLITPLLAAFLPWRRPMDGVRFHMFAPQEEEFGVLSMCGQSPLWGMTFPKRWPEYDRYIFPSRLAADERRQWQRNYLAFLNRVYVWSKKRPLLKNPYNTGRAEILKEMFPGAKFVHICRNPHTVYRSNCHLANEGHVVTQLQDPAAGTSYGDRFPQNYRAMEEAFEQDAEAMAEDQVVRVRFEDLEQDPVDVIRKIYAMLNLEFTVAYEKALQDYLQSIAGYRKNRHRDLAADERQVIDQEMRSFAERWGYAEQTESDGSGRRAA